MSRKFWDSPSKFQIFLININQLILFKAKGDYCHKIWTFQLFIDILWNFQMYKDKVAMGKKDQ